MSDLTAVTSGLGSAATLWVSDASLTPIDRKMTVGNLFAEGPKRKNYLINGNFSVWQRGTSFSNTTDSLFTADRWRLRNRDDSATMTFTQGVFGTGQTDVEGNPEYYASVGNIDANAYIHTRLEGVQRLTGKTLTISFWARLTAGDPSLKVSCQQNMGGGGGTSLADTFGTFTLTSSWAKYTSTVTLHTLSGSYGTSPYFMLYIGQGNSLSFDIAQIQLEEGSVATPFEYRPIAEELALCYRYFIQWTRYPNDGYLYGTTGTLRRGFTYCFPVTMRASPTVATIAAPTYVGCSDGASHSASQTDYVHRVTLASDTIYRVNEGTFAASAEL